jgi:hypothetical protein
VPAGDTHSPTQSNRSWTRDLLIVACAVSAGIHTALTPEHLAEGTAPGLAFAASAAALAGLCVALTVHPGVVPPLATSVLLAGLVAAYGLAVTSGLPVLHPEAEPVEALAVVTKAVELLGLAAALHLVLRGRELPRAVRPRPKGRFA